MKNKVLYLGPKSHLKFLKDSLLDFEIIHANEEEIVDKFISESQVIFDAYMKIEFNADRQAIDFAACRIFCALLPTSILRLQKISYSS